MTELKDDGAGAAKGTRTVDPEWEPLRRLMAERGEGFDPPRDCGQAAEFMAQVEASRTALDRLAHRLQSAHLACCILPDVGESEEVVLALERLSEARIGALIVIEQQQSLEQYMARGTPLDARMSASLLESLFYPGGRLHDGAVIMRGARIIAAGVFLPLVTEQQMSLDGHSLGARHRAAIGMSRLTDAVILAVSEETGEVSLAVNGVLHRGVPVNGIRSQCPLIVPDDRLTERMAGTGARGSRLALWVRGLFGG